jgi:hypothetical protein
MKMRIDGHIDTAVGQVFHVVNKTNLSSAMWTALDFLTWDTSFPPAKAVQEAGWKTIQRYIDNIYIDPVWSRGEDIECDYNGKIVSDFLDEYAFLLELYGFPLKVNNLFSYLSLIFHNDEMYREKMGWAFEWFSVKAFADPVSTGLVNLLIPRIRPDIIPGWFRYNRPSVWTDTDYLSIFDNMYNIWNEYDKRENRKGHISGMYRAFVKLFERDAAFRQATKDMLLWLRDKEFVHEDWFEPERWYPASRGCIHYGVHGGIL